jgi:MSHA biogenesis protein MshP
MRVIARRKKQCGASLMMAIFILVVLSLLGVAMIRILAVGTDVVAREVVSARALLAAESGAQKKLSEIFPPGAVGSNTALCASAPGVVGLHTYTGAVGELAGISGCSSLRVEVSCSYVLVGVVNYFTIKSRGRCGPTSDPAVRIIEVQAKGI